jgi:hypothetical protein
MTEEVLLLNSGQRVRYHQKITESLQTEGWAYFQLAGLRYRRYTSHAKAYPRFAQRTEKLLSQTSTRSSDEGQLEEEYEDEGEDEVRSSRRM